MEASAASGHGRRAAPLGIGGPFLRVASDERLVAAVRDGSERAFEVVYDRHHRGILSFCRHMLSDASEAEDAVQHTFMAAYRDLVGSEKAIQLKPWLYTIARNRCLSILRARRERPSDDVDGIATENLAAEVQQRQDLRDLLGDLAELPEEQRAALVLSELGDVSHDEIADVLGCRREKVKALVFQARSSLSASRKARDTDCSVIREQLATLRGSSLRRSELRRHLKVCDGCREFAGEVAAQRKLLAIALPVIPTLGLKENALAAAFGSSGAGAAGMAAGGAAGGAAMASGGSAITAKALVVVALAGGGGGATVAAVSGDAPVGAGESSSSQPATGTGGSPGGAPAPAADGGQDTADRARSGDTPIKRRVRKNRKERAQRRERREKERRAQAQGRDDRTRGGGHETKSQRDDEKAQRKAQRETDKAAEREALAQRKAQRESARPQRPEREPKAPKPDPTPRPSPKPQATPEPEPDPEPEVTPAPKGKGEGSGLEPLSP